MTHICVSKLTIIGSDNGLSPDRRQAIIWTNAGLLLTGPLGTNVSEILTWIQTFSFKKMHSNISSAKWCPFCLGLNVLISSPQWVGQGCRKPTLCTLCLALKYYLANKNIVRHTACTIVSWPYPEQWLMNHIFDMMMIRITLNTNILTFIKEKGKLITLNTRPQQVNTGLIMATKTCPLTNDD